MVGASCRSPIMGVRPDAPTIEIIVLVTSYEIITTCRREIVFGWREYTKMDAGCQEEKPIFS